MSVERISTLLDKTWSRAETFLSSLVNPTTRSSMASSPSSSAAIARRDTEVATRPEINWLAFGIEVTLRFAIAVASGVLLMQLARQFSGMPSDPNEDPTPSASSVYSRLDRILRKRLEKMKYEEEEEESTNCGGSVKDKIRSPAVSIPQLTPYERKMAEDIIDPDDIETSFGDIGGMHATKQEIFELAVLPLVQPDLFVGKLVQPTKGILLYGPPGTGKTMLAKALAKEAHAVFLPLQLSKILSKWVGESNKLIAATFSLARKLQPSIIFIDELDTFLKANNTETAYLDAIKAEFLTLWDGISTTQNSRVMVLGATNKPQTIDPAIQRRMPRIFEVKLPNPSDRHLILQSILKDENVEQDVYEFLPALASNRMTAGYSGSDLRELCRAAAMIRVQERASVLSQQRVMGEKTKTKVSKAPLRPIYRQDLVMALEKVGRTGEATKEYGRHELRELALADIRAAAALNKELETNDDGDDDDDDDDDNNIPDIPDV